jgi:hypothetical protein
MRLSLAAAFLLATCQVGQAFVPSPAASRWGATNVYSTVEADTSSAPVVADTTEANGVTVPGDVSASSIVAKLEAQLEKLREKDSKSPKLTKEVS